MQCRCWCTAENYWPIKGALTEKIKLALDDAGVPFYSQTKVNIAK
jgi:small-conductance mechanosensitive channel